MSQPMSRTEYAAHRGVGKSYISKLGNEGRLVLTADGKVDRDRTDALLDATADPGRADVAARHAQNRPAAAAYAPQPPDAAASGYQGARAVKERYLALEAKRAYEYACGQLMQAAEVNSAVLDAATSLRRRLEAMPDVLASRLSVPMTEADRRVCIADYVEVMLQGMVSDFKKLTDTQHAPA